MDEKAGFLFKNDIHFTAPFRLYVLQYFICATSKQEENRQFAQATPNRFR